MKKKILSFVLATCLFCSTFPPALGTEGEGLIQLAAPTDLRWHVYRQNQMDGILKEFSLPGCLSWNGTGSQGHYRLKIYRQGEITPIFDTTCGNDGWNNIYENYFFSNSMFLSLTSIAEPERSPYKANLDSGMYYYTVQALGDGIIYCDSEDSLPSESFKYVKPNICLMAPTDLKWHGLTATFELATDLADHVYSYSIEFRYSPNDSISDAYRIAGVTTSSKSWAVPEYAVQENGPGYYWFRVHTNSSDITKYQGSDWSEFSPAYHLTNISTQDSLYNILNDTEIFTPEEIRQAVYDLNTGDLKNALLADQNEPGGTAELLARLEEKTGVAVSTAAEKPEFEEMAAETQIIGAALNDVPDGTDSVTLNIGSPEKEHVIPEQYHNTVALHFSMGLEGVTNQQDLKVPVRVILPIPSTINPAFLVLLHYGQDGSVEAIEQPYKFQKDGKWYVSIVLTHFSDFVMTEEKQAEPSRPSGGSSSSSDDAPTYAITLPKDIEGGSVSVSPKRAEKGDKVTLTATPEAGHRVKQVTVTDKNGKEIELTRQEDGTYTFLMPGGPVTVSAQFVTRSVEVIPPPPLPFVDVDDDAEYRDSVAYVYDKGLMNGTSDTTFEPETETSRAMLITILHRLDGQPAPENRPDFADVPAGEWYSDAVGWAVEKGIVLGFEDNTFRPEELLTKEHLTTILYRYADYKGYDVTQREALSDYIDRDAVSAYAVEAIGWAKAKGLLNMEERMLLPGERVRRRRVADMVMQFCENVIG